MQTVTLIIKYFCILLYRQEYCYRRNTQKHYDIILAISSTPILGVNVILDVSPWSVAFDWFPVDIVTGFGLMRWKFRKLVSGPLSLDFPSLACQTGHNFAWGWRSLKPNPHLKPIIFGQRWGLWIYQGRTYS